MNQPIIINFESTEGTEKQVYQVILKDLNEALIAAKGNLEAMRNLNMLSKELRYATEAAIDELLFGPRVKKDNVLPEARL